MHGMTQAERRRIRGRMGTRLYRRRILLEDTRELKLGKVPPAYYRFNRRIDTAPTP